MSLLGNSSADANDVFLSFLFLPQPINSILLITYNDITITHRPHEILRQCNVQGCGIDSFTAGFWRFGKCHNETELTVNRISSSDLISTFSTVQGVNIV